MRVLKQVLDYFFIGFSFIASKKLFAVLTVCMFISLLQVSMGYREELLQKEQEMMFEKGNPEVTYYNQNEVEVSTDGESAASKLVSCYKKGLAASEVNAEIKGYIDRLNALYNESGEYFSFLYQDLFSGFTVSYNEGAPIFTASTIKAPAMIYLYEQASNGQVDLNERLVYTSNFYSEGSGILKTKGVGTSYSVEELIGYAIHYSDNVAYRMLMSRFGRENVLAFWQEKGTSYIFTLETIWGVTSALDASIYMQELYRFYQDNQEYGGKLMDYFKNVEWKLIVDKDGYLNTASKGGWSGQAIHDAAIVFDENPYILVIMSNTGESNYNYLFKETSSLVGNLHEEYWKYKEAVCNEIKQY